MAHELVVHCKESDYDVYVGRPSKWGNPFVIGRDGERGEVIAKYEEWLMEPQNAWRRKLIKKELRGKVLGCWCAPKACHGEVLARLANE